LGFVLSALSLSASLGFVNNKTKTGNKKSKKNFFNRGGVGNRAKSGKLSFQHYFPEPKP